MLAVYAWLMAHLPMIASVLALIVAVDHVLAASDLFKANSTAQAIFNAIASVVSFIQKLLPGGGNPPAAS